MIFELKIFWMKRQDKIEKRSKAGEKINKWSGYCSRRDLANKQKICFERQKVIVERKRKRVTEREKRRAEKEMNGERESRYRGEIYISRRDSIVTNGGH